METATMPQRNSELPEGTDHIVNGAMNTDGGNAGSGGSSSGFVGSSAGDDTGGTSSGAASLASAGGGGSGGTTGSSGLGGSGGGDFGGGAAGNGSGNGAGTGGIKSQLRDGAANLQSQAGDKIRSYAETGKERATSALDELTQVVNDAASSIDERLGSEYGEYARRAADAVAGFADTLRGKEVDELYEDGRNLVRKSPGVAIGVAAVVGFSLVRLLKAGFESSDDRGRRDVEFTPDPQLEASSGATVASTGASGTTTGTGI